jgi:exodeoxyribonuclease V gamma subunit
MNNADFPRKQPSLSFDLALKVRTQADLDKQLFLNSLLGAKEKIYVSYIGQSVKDNSSIPPSTVVDELIAAIEPLLAKNEVNNLITRHPLHGFSSLYNSIEHPNLIRYFSEDNPVNIQKVAANDESVDFSNKIQINDLYRFLADPIKWYYNKTLGIYYNEEDATLAETELFSLNHLEKWIIKDEILNLPDFDENNLEAYRSEKVKRGSLPLSKTGELLLQKTYEEVEKLKVLFGDITKGESSSVNLESFAIGDYFLSGQINSVYGNTLAFGTVSKDKYKYRLKALIQYLVLVASGRETMDLCYLHIESNSVKLVSGISKEAAKTILKRWCGYFEMGQKKMLPFSIDFSYFDKKTKKDNYYSFFQSLIDKQKAGTNITEELNSKIDTIRNPSFGDCYLSDYQKKEIDNNFFDNEETASEFLSIYEDIIFKLNNYFI